MNQTSNKDYEKITERPIELISFTSLPPADVLEQYADIDKNLPDQIAQSTLHYMNNQAHVQQLQARTTRAVRLGAVYGSLILAVLGTIMGGIILVKTDREFLEGLLFILIGFIPLLFTLAALLVRPDRQSDQKTSK